MERTMQRTLRVLEKLEQFDPNLFEIRLDLIKDVSSLAAIRQRTNRPMIATIRRRGNGGFFDGKEATRMEKLIQAAKAGFDYIDIDLNSNEVGESVGRFEREGAKAIVSYHNSKTTPGTTVLESILKKEKRAGADICKIVTTARSPADNLRCLTFVNKHSRNVRMVCFAMGRLGTSSRVLSPVFGAYFTFASSGIGKETASGQLPISELRMLYKCFQGTRTGS
jgi:3-dehydroquinate dehydratase type I